MVECELPKLETWVRFPSLAPFVFVILLISFLAGCKSVETPYMADTKTTGGVYHYVRRGETLWGISKLYNVDMNTILTANNISESADITRGQRLLIPGPSAVPEAPAVERKVNFSYSNFFAWPLKGTVVSPYGAKLDRTKNKGIDIRAEEGSSVRASRGGKVVFCDEWLKGFGKTVIIDHGDNFQTVYAYNSTILVKVGDAVEQNMVIAKVGRGGRAKDASLHFEIRRNGEPQNPFYYLSK